MNIISEKTKAYISTWFLVFFVLSLLAMTGSSILFQHTAKIETSEDILARPIRLDILANLKTIRFKNRLGSVVVTNENNQWIIKEPVIMPAKEKTITKIIASLQDIKVHTLHQYEPINIESFSLNNPLVTLDLFSKLDEQSEIKVGLINPINNTSYMTVSGKNRIFQTSILKNKVEQLALSDFIDSNVFSKDASEIKSFTLYRGNIKDPTNQFSYDGTQWNTKKYNKVSQENVVKKLNSILEIKTHMIIDQKDEKIQTIIDNYISHPLYQIKIITRTGEEIEYKVSPLAKSLPMLKLEKRQYFFMTATDRPYPYVIHKDALNQFLIRYKDVR